MGVNVTKKIMTDSLDPTLSTNLVIIGVGACGVTVAAGSGPHFCINHGADNTPFG
jgi:hypothetical protein